MNWEDSSGGSSCNGQENGDRFNGAERPLKKARYAWQVKGKYHLKNENNDPSKISTTESTVPEMAGPSGSGNNSSDSNNIGTEQDINTIGGYLSNKNFNNLDSVVEKPDKSSLKPSKRKLGSRDSPVCNIFTPRATMPEDILSHTRNICSEETWKLKQIEAQIGSSQDSLSKYMLPTEFVRVPMTPSANYTEDQCIASWQARQMVNGPLDNTINQLLDYIKQNPLQEDHSALNAYDVADFINNLPGTNSVENEGILMAISAHGLQNTSNSSSSSFDSFSNMNFPELYSSSPESLKICFSPIHSDDEYEESPREYECSLDSLQWYSDEMKTEDNETIPSPTFHGTSSLTFQNLYENLHNTDAASNDVTMENDNHRDFLDAAVLFAIQSKGLTTFGTDYG